MQAAQLLQQGTSLPTALIGLGLVLLLLPKLRRIMWDCLETVIASLLLLVLVTAVLGLPFGESLSRAALSTHLEVIAAAQHFGKAMGNGSGCNKQQRRSAMKVRRCPPPCA